SYLENAPGTPLSPNATIADPDTHNLVGMTVKVSAGTFANDGDTLSAVTTGTHITPTYDAASETLTLSGLDTLADYQQVLRTVAFSSSSNDPDDSGAHPDRTISYTVANPAVADGALHYQFFGFPSGISFSFGVDQVPTTGGIAGTATDFDVAALATTLQ